MSEVQTTTEGWVSVNTLSGITTGTRIKIQNQTTKSLVLKESTTEPLITDFSGEIITPLGKGESSKIIIEDGLEVWVRNKKEGSGIITLYVQEWSV